MKTVLRTAVAGLAIASLGLSSTAFAATDTSDAEATIIAALTVTLDTLNGRDLLDFGTLAESGAGGTITLTPAGAPTCGSGLVCAGPYNTPNFDIDGETGATVNISLTDPTIDLIGAGDPMAVALTLSDVQMVLDGTDSFDVGGTLTVNANQAVGTYVGQMEVNVVYN